MPAWREFTIEFEGRTVRGRYSTSGEMIHVGSDMGVSKSTQLNGLVGSPETLARILLRELAQQGKA
jgi:hypothetical protein